MKEKKKDAPEKILKEIEKGGKELLDIYQKSRGKQFDRFELYVLRNIFTIPNEIEIKKKNIHAGLSAESLSKEEKNVDQELQYALMTLFEVRKRFNGILSSISIETNVKTKSAIQTSESN